MKFASHRTAEKRVIFVLVIAMIGIMSSGMVMPVLPELIEKMIGSNARAGLVNGWLVALFAGLQFFFSPIIGSLSDRYGRRPLIVMSMGGVTLDFILIALAPNLWWIVLGRIVSGATASLHTAFAYMADITTPVRRARSFGVMGAMMTAGLIAGPLSGGLLSMLSPRAPFWGAAAIAAIGFAYILLMVPESLDVEKRREFTWRRANPFGALMLLRSHSDLLGLSVVFFFLSFVEPLFQSVLVLYAVYRYEWGGLEIGGLFALGGLLTITVQSVVVGPAVQRFGERRAMIVGLLSGTLGVIGMGLAPNGILFALSMLPYSLISLVMPTIQSLMTQRVSESEQGQLQAANNCVASIAGVVSPLAFGFVYSISVGDTPIIPVPGAAFFCAAVALLLGVAAGVSANDRARGSGGAIRV